MWWSLVVVVGKFLNTLRLEHTKVVLKKSAQKVVLNFKNVNNFTKHLARLIYGYSNCFILCFRVWHIYQLARGDSWSKWIQVTGLTPADKIISLPYVTRNPQQWWRIYAVTADNKVNIPPLCHQKPSAVVENLCCHS